MGIMRPRACSPASRLSSLLNNAVNHRMKNHVADLIGQALAQLQSAGELPAAELPSIQVEHTRDKAHGDFASNIALALSKSAKRPPRQVAEAIVKALPPSTRVTKVEIAGP